MLIDEVCDFLLPAAAAHAVADVRVGLGYTAVQLDDGRCGLAYTFRDDVQEGCCVISEAGTLTGRRAADLATWAKSSDAVARVVGLATLNALTDVPPDTAEAGLLTEFQVTSKDVIGMVGYFGPLVSPLRSRGMTLHVFERHPMPETDVLPEASAVQILPQCDVVILSATTFINRTLDGLLPLGRNAHDIAILGPSTPLLPAVFVDRGITALSGVRASTCVARRQRRRRNTPVRQGSEESNPPPCRCCSRINMDTFPK